MIFEWRFWICFCFSFASVFAEYVFRLVLQSGLPLSVAAVSLLKTGIKQEWTLYNKILHVLLRFFFKSALVQDGSACLFLKSMLLEDGKVAFKTAPCWAAKSNFFWEFPCNDAEARFSLSKQRFFYGKQKVLNWTKYGKTEILTICAWFVDNWPRKVYRKGIKKSRCKKRSKIIPLIRDNNLWLCG